MFRLFTWRAACCIALFAIIAAALPAATTAAADPESVPAPSRPEPLLGRTSAQQTIELSVSLKPKDAGAIDAFLADLYNPLLPDYQKYLTATEYTDRFYDPHGREIVRNFLQSKNLSVSDPGVGSVITATGATA